MSNNTYPSDEEIFGLPRRDHRLRYRQNLRTGDWSAAPSTAVEIDRLDAYYVPWWYRTFGGYDINQHWRYHDVIRELPEHQRRMRFRFAQRRERRRRREFFSGGEFRSQYPRLY